MLRSYFARFRDLDFGTAYPLLLSLYEDHSDGMIAVSAFVAALKILDSYIVRRMVVGVASNSLPDVFLALCKSKPDTDEPAVWLSAALTAFSKNRRWPTDIEFRELWMHAPIYTRRRLCPVVLSCLENHLRGITSR